MGAVLLLPSLSFAASCCGGGSGGSLILPKFRDLSVGATIAYEKYDGFWDKDGLWHQDPAGSKLSQTRLNLGIAKRINDNWQASLAMPYIWNDNQYANNSFKTSGVGDSSITVLYEAFDDITCTWVLDTWEDYKPAMYFGATLTVPTGISPYDDVSNNFDITGRGFYRLDLKSSFEKTVYPWNATVAFNYGTYFKRSINREYGVYVAPYDKTLGDRVSSSASLGYTIFLKKGDTLTLTGAYSYLKEAKATIAGIVDSTSGVRKQGFSGTAAWSTEDKSMVFKATYSYTPHYHNWGQNFPTTSSLSLGVNYVYD
ncbi:MAG: hypothetical protein Q9N62_12345 [Ghiorsea sp.]|nr:hypothetical protein [Ghiorsea sp.]